MNIQYKNIILSSKKFTNSLKRDLSSPYVNFFVILWMVSYFVLPIIMYWYSLDLSGFMIIGLPIIWIILFLLLRSFLRFLWKYVKMFFEKIIFSLNNLRQDDLDISTINKILEKAESVHKIFSTLNNRLYILKMIASKETIILFKRTTELIGKFLIDILSDLRSDLTARLIEQEKAIESAKREVEKHIQWTIVLEQVSELQKARLDRQIEQFEELQKVLVKT